MCDKITASALGGQNKTFDNVKTVADLAEQMGLGEKHSVTVNGEPATYESELESYSFVAFGEKVKGGTNS